jgi:hypothetical protein
VAEPQAVTGRGDAKPPPPPGPGRSVREWPTGMPASRAQQRGEAGRAPTQSSAAVAVLASSASDSDPHWQWKQAGPGSVRRVVLMQGPGGPGLGVPAPKSSDHTLARRASTARADSGSRGLPGTTGAVATVAHVPRL